MSKTTDDASGFFDRSLGAQEHGAADTGPHQLVSASNRATAPSSTRRGDLETGFDAGGNLTDLVVRRDGPCLPATASCWQRYHYGFDELGRLDVANRWDLVGNERTAHDGVDDAVPARAADVELRNIYDSAGSRVIKTAVDTTGNQSHSVYINSSYELRKTWWSDGDFVLTPDTVTVYVSGGGVQGRVVYSEDDLPSSSSGKQRLFLMLGDYLGSNSSVIDHETGELVEYSTYQAYGGAESDYRPARWGEFRESYKFTGKEEDVEVGLAYFGARFLVIGLGRWASPTPRFLKASGVSCGIAYVPQTFWHLPLWPTGEGPVSASAGWFEGYDGHRTFLLDRPCMTSPECLNRIGEKVLAQAALKIMQLARCPP